jgi:hypothetical protein
MSDEDATALTARGRGRSRWSWLVLVVVLAGAAYLVARDADELGTALRQLGWARVAGAAGLALLATLAIGMIWLSLLRGVGVRVETVDAAATFYVTQLGKYVPGSVWPIVAQAAAGRRWGAPARLMVLVNLVMLALLGVTGLLVGTLLLPWTIDASWASPWWLLAVPLLLPFLHPAVVPAVLGRVLGRLGREPFDRQVTPRGMYAATAWCLATWLLLGLHLWLLLASLDDVGAAGLAAMVGAIGLGWAVGLVVVVAPAGAGVRDGIVIAAAASYVDASQAAAVALASRVVLVLVDVALAAVGALSGARRARTSGRDKGASA